MYIYVLLFYIYFLRSAGEVESALGSGPKDDDDDEDDEDDGYF